MEAARLGSGRSDVAHRRSDRWSRVEYLNLREPASQPRLLAVMREGHVANQTCLRRSTRRLTPLPDLDAAAVSTCLLHDADGNAGRARAGRE